MRNNRWTSVVAGALLVLVGMLAACSNDDEIVVAVKERASAVGDVVLRDGTAVAAEGVSNMTAEQKEQAVAVIFYVGGGEDDVLGKKLLGVGLADSQKEAVAKLKWARWESNDDCANGYHTSITTIACGTTKEKPTDGPCYAYTYLGDTYYMTGDFDGSDNYSALKTFLSESETDDTGTEGNYPAFEWAENYAANHELTDTDYATGWYLPSAVELHLLYSNKLKVNRVLSILGSTQLADEFYWSSSQNADVNARLGAWYVSFATGELTAYYPKTNEYFACCIRAFSD